MAEWFRKTTIGSLVEDASRRYPTREALYFNGQRWTFRQFQEDVERAALGLLSLGISPGEKVSLWMPNCPEWLHIFYAVAQIGAVLVPINTRLRTEDLRYVLHQSDSSTLIIKDRSGPIDYLGMVKEVCPELAELDPDSLAFPSFPELKRVAVLGAEQVRGTRSWKEVISAADAVSQEELQARQEAVNPDDTVLLMYTSGTTGFPKGVMHNHNILRITTDSINRMGMTANDVVMMYLPLFHAFGLYEGALMFLQACSRMVLTETFDAAWEMVRDEHFDPSLNGVDWNAVRAELRPRAAKARYHAGAVLAGNASTALWLKFFEMLDEMGIPREAAHAYLEQTCRNLATVAPDAVLTGPIARRDAGTVRANLDALSGDPFAEVYLAFVRALAPDLTEE